jgi:hypothetical protein
MISRFLQIFSAVLVAACSMPCESQTYTTGKSYPLIVVDNGPGDQSDPWSDWFLQTRPRQ